MIAFFSLFKQKEILFFTEGIKRIRKEELRKYYSGYVGKQINELFWQIPNKIGNPYDNTIFR